MKITFLGKNRREGGYKRIWDEIGGGKGPGNVEENWISSTDCHPCLGQLSCTPEWMVKMPSSLELH